MKTRFEPRLPRMSSWKSNKHDTLALNSGPLASYASILPLDHHSWYTMSPQSCPCQDPSWRNMQICQTSKSDLQEWQSLVVLIKANTFLNGTNISFLKFICGNLNRGVANSFWNHVIQISSRQMYFQYIYSNLWKVKVFSGNIYSLKSDTYFWETVLFVQDGFLYLIMTRHKLTVQDGGCPFSILYLPTVHPLTFLLALFFPYPCWNSKPF